MLNVPELAQDADPLPRLTVSHRLLLIQPRQQPSPGLDQQVGRGLKLLENRNSDHHHHHPPSHLELRQEVSILRGQPSPHRLQVDHVAVVLLNPLVDIIETEQQVLVLLLGRGLGPVHLLRGAPHVPDLSLDLDLVLLDPDKEGQFKIKDNCF